MAKFTFDQFVTISFPLSFVIIFTALMQKYGLKTGNDIFGNIIVAALSSFVIYVVIKMGNLFLSYISKEVKVEKTHKKKQKKRK